MKVLTSPHLTLHDLHDGILTYYNDSYTPWFCADFIQDTFGAQPDHMIVVASQKRLRDAKKVIVVRYKTLSCDTPGQIVTSSDWRWRYPEWTAWFLGLSATYDLHKSVSHLLSENFGLQRRVALWIKMLPQNDGRPIPPEIVNLDKGE
jgi:hypothetical protein